MWVKHHTVSMKEHVMMETTHLSGPCSSQGCGSVTCDGIDQAQPFLERHGEHFADFLEFADLLYQRTHAGAKRRDVDSLPPPTHIHHGHGNDLHHILSEFMMRCFHDYEEAERFQRFFDAFRGNEIDLDEAKRCYNDLQQFRKRKRELNQAKRCHDVDAQLRKRKRQELHAILNDEAKRRLEDRAQLCERRRMPATTSSAYCKSREDDSADDGSSSSSDMGLLSSLTS